MLDPHRDSNSDSSVVQQNLKLQRDVSEKAVFRVWFEFVPNLAWSLIINVSANANRYSQEYGVFGILPWERSETLTLLGPLERTNINHRTDPSPEDGNRSCFRNVVSFYVFYNARHEQFPNTL
jgi:hypothetical protein